MTNKFITVRKEKDQYMKENKELQNEILILQSNMRQMIPGFSNNTSSSFPMLNELQNKLSEFLKCDCQDIFFDLLSPELNMDGIVYFFSNSFVKVHEVITIYFEPVEKALKKTLCIDELWSTIDNVLRKSYQSNWKKVFNQLCSEQLLKQIMMFIQNALKLRDEDPSADKIILDFLRKLCEIMFYCHISDPPIFIDYNTIGQKVSFNAIKHESADGFIKQKTDCIVILPSVYKLNTNAENCILKAQVLPVDYEFP
jgi:hypothetical protein